MQKTAYGMLISDWSSDVCSSDLETDAEFEQLLEFLDIAQLDRVGAFAYSPVEGASANALPDPVPEALKQERLARFMERQAAISADKLEARRSEEHTSELQSLMRISYAVFCLKKKKPE